MEIFTEDQRIILSSIISSTLTTKALRLGKKIDHEALSGWVVFNINVIILAWKKEYDRSGIQFDIWYDQRVDSDYIFLCGDVKVFY